MEVEQTKDNAPDKSSDARAPQVKLSARGLVGTDPKETSSWSILKNLHMSIIDGGVSILKQGLSRLTGSAQRADLSTIQQVQQPVPQAGAAQKEGPADSGERKSMPMDELEQSPASEDSSYQDDSPEFGTDWIDDLLEELDSSEANTNEVQEPQSDPAHDTTPGSKVVSDGQEHSVNITADAPSDHPGF